MSEMHVVSTWGHVGYRTSERVIVAKGLLYLIRDVWYIDLTNPPKEIHHVEYGTRDPSNTDRVKWVEVSRSNDVFGAAPLILEKILPLTLVDELEQSLEEFLDQPLDPWKL